MLSREYANNYLRSVIEENINDTNWGTEITLAANKKFNVPIGIVKDILSKNNDVENITDFILYSIISVIDSKQLKNFFTDIEIHGYKKEKYNDTITIPSTFKVVRIADDQWVGRISITDWMALRDLQKINYNENTQRPLKKIVRGESVVYKTDINRNQVENIYNSIMNDTYIPDTITLNLPEDSLWDYDEETSTLEISYYSHFDITDGMHRYLAFSKAYDSHKNFEDYYEELRITIFDNRKAENFIWQEDQKHRLTKVASRSFNQNSIGSLVCNRLNKNSPFKGKILKSKGVIDYMVLSNAISVLYEEKKRGRKSQTDQIQLKQLEIETYKKFNQALDEIIEEDINLLSEHWSELFTYCFVAAIFNNVESNYLDFINKLSANKVINNGNKDSVIKSLTKEGALYV